MKIKTTEIKKYVARDWKEFDSEENCRVHETEIMPKIIEYMDWKKYEFSYDWHEWHKWIFAWYQANYWTEAIRYSYIRPLQSEHPDIIQARELLEKSWYSVTKI